MQPYFYRNSAESYNGKTIGHQSFFIFLYMILYNISIIIEDGAHHDLFSWLKNMLREISYETKFLKMLDSPHEGSTYCIQMTAADEETIQNFQTDVLQTIQAYIGNNHNEKAFIFDSKMQYLDLD